ncbi:uncharacterized protein LOC109711359 isoform X2 [Ananas comosus]|uniref:Uncharacterized protein LOC109711359 isoform X2 n=1 Tax=Ananas comosus TaxID=4615 RepID=A0A6P5F2U2_ANACO|nr:uncharacterized protein LOC109711359 isoform X2 [Ananas comosus]
MDRRDSNNTFARGEQHILRNPTNISGKRPLCLDSEKPNNENKVTQCEEPAVSAHQDINSESQFHASNKENVVKGKGIIEAPPGSHRHVYDRKGKCIDTKENIPPYFGSRELSPEMKEDCKEDYETDNVDTVRTENRLKFDAGGCSSRYDPLGCSRPSGPLNSEMGGSKEFLNIHAAPNSESIKGQSCVNLDKSCTCSFCVKAAYMWTDLQYQDLRGRLAALKKSRGLARKLLGSCCDHEPARRTTSESSQQSADTEFQLMEQWRSLFLYTENALDRETSKIQSTLQRMGELRENCKKDLLKTSKGSLD